MDVATIRVAQSANWILHAMRANIDHVWFGSFSIWSSSLIKPNVVVAQEKSSSDAGFQFFFCSTVDLFWQSAGVKPHVRMGPSVEPTTHEEESVALVARMESKSKTEILISAGDVSWRHWILKVYT